MPLLTIFSETGFVALVVALSTLAGGVPFAIVVGHQRSAERRQRARTEAIRTQLRVLYKPLMRILGAYTVPLPDPDPMDWDDAVKGRLSEAFEIVDENLEYAPRELIRLLHDYRSSVAYGAANSYEELEILYRYVRDQFDQLRRELLMIPSEHKAFWLIRLWRWLGQKWHSWRAKRRYPPRNVK